MRVLPAFCGCLASAAAFLPPTASRGRCRRIYGSAGAAPTSAFRNRRGVFGSEAATMVTEEGSKGVTVTLGDYKAGLKIAVPQVAVSDAQLQAALQTFRKPYKLVPVRFVEEGGTKMGHTVIINWQAGGVKKDNFELELTLEQPEPWRTFAQKIAVGMGQMETKVFPCAFPPDFSSAPLAGKTAQVAAVVRQIMRKEAKEPDARPDDAIVAELRVRAEGQAAARMEQLADEAIKQAMLEACHVDADKVLSSVSWAKFGTKSTLDFKWNCIKEKVAAVEGIQARDVAAFLRTHADISYVAAVRR